MTETEMQDKLSSALLMGHDFDGCRGGIDHLPEPLEGEWDVTAVEALELARHMAAKVDAIPAAVDTGDGWLFIWLFNHGAESECCTETTMAPLLPEDWWPGPDRLRRSDLVALNILEL